MEAPNREEYLYRFKLLRAHGINFSFDPYTLSLEELKEQYIIMCDELNNRNKIRRIENMKAVMKIFEISIPYEIEDFTYIKNHTIDEIYILLVDKYNIDLKLTNAISECKIL